MTQDVERVGGTREKLMLVEQAIYPCNNAGCGRLFKTKFALKRHLLVHTKDRSCVCRYCGKKFSLPQYMREHLYTHTREKPYVCGVAGCQERFRQAGKLSLHRRTHAEYCVKKYNFKLNPKVKRPFCPTLEQQPAPQPSNTGTSGAPLPLPTPIHELSATAVQAATIPIQTSIINKKVTETDTYVHSICDNDKKPKALECECVHATQPDPTVHTTKAKDYPQTRSKPLPSISLFFASTINNAALLKSYRNTLACKQCAVPERAIPYLLPMDKCLPWLTLPYRPLFRPLLPLPCEHTPRPASNSEQSWTS